MPEVALVTGASQGIGRAIALAYGGRGSVVVLAARSGDRLAAVAAEVRAAGGTPYVVPTDVRDPAAIRMPSSPRSATSTSWSTTRDYLAL